MPLGLMDGASYGSYTADCQVGDRFLLYTDGVTEAMNKDDELFGEERLETVVAAHTQERPEALIKAVRNEVAAFAAGAEQSDDITMLSLEFGLHA